MPATWPASLPDHPLLDGYGEQPANPVTSTERNEGPFQARRRFTVTTATIRATWLMTGAQLQELERWLSVDLAGGALSFFMRHPSRDGWARFRFDGPPTWSAMGLDRWRVTTSLVLLPT